MKRNKKRIASHFLIVLALISLLVAGCSGPTNSSKEQTGGIVEPQKLTEGQMNEQQDGVDTKQNTVQNFINFDVLSKQALRVSQGSTVEYSKEELASMKQEEWRKDYSEVVREFAESKLMDEITFIHSIDGFYNPRIVVVGGGTDQVYRLDVVKRQNYDDIWTVNGYAAVRESNEGKLNQPIQYNIVSLSEVDKEIETWAKEIIDSGKAAEEYFITGSEDITDNQTYILLSAGSDGSVELLNVRAGDMLISLDYALGTVDEEMYGRTKYLLLKFDSPAMDILIHKYTTRTTNDIRPYM